MQFLGLFLSGESTKVSNLSMSWKATAFVKELRRNLTVTEKFVLLILADYHRTDDKRAWPSTETLAIDCLMEERSVRQILGRLVEKQFLRRTIGGGRGNCNAYQIVGLDVKKGEQKTGFVETGFIETGRETLNVHAANPVSPASPYKVLRDLTGEPVGQEICFQCNGKKFLHQLPHMPGPRLIRCPRCTGSA
jgi:Helix-turn-helix domain